MLVEDLKNKISADDLALYFLPLRALSKLRINLDFLNRASRVEGRMKAASTTRNRADLAKSPPELADKRRKSDRLQIRRQCIV